MNSKLLEQKTEKHEILMLICGGRTKSRCELDERRDLVTYITVYSAIYRYTDRGSGGRGARCPTRRSSTRLCCGVYAPVSWWIFIITLIIISIIIIIDVKLEQIGRMFYSENSRNKVAPARGRTDHFISKNSSNNFHPLTVNFDLWHRPLNLILVYMDGVKINHCPKYLGQMSFVQKLLPEHSDIHTPDRLYSTRTINVVINNGF